MVEQLPHCDLLRLSLSTGRFVLSARQVFCQRLFFFFAQSCRLPGLSVFEIFVKVPGRLAGLFKHGQKNSKSPAPQTPGANFTENFKVDITVFVSAVGGP